MTTLNAIFRATSQRQFENQLAVADRLSALSVTRHMSLFETLDALVCSLCSIVQAGGDPSEWADAADTIADEIKRRLTVTGDTGDDHHRRWMV